MLPECKNCSFEIHRAESLNLHNKIRDLIVELIRAQKYTRDINDLPVFSSKTWRRESDNNTILKDDFLLQCRNYFLPVYRDILVNRGLGFKFTKEDNDAFIRKFAYSCPLSSEAIAKKNNNKSYMRLNLKSNFQTQV